MPPPDNTNEVEGSEVNNKTHCGACSPEELLELYVPFAHYYDSGLMLQKRALWRRELSATSSNLEVTSIQNVGAPYAADAFAGNCSRSAAPFHSNAASKWCKERFDEQTGIRSCSAAVSSASPVPFGLSLTNDTPGTFALPEQTAACLSALVGEIRPVTDDEVDHQDLQLYFPPVKQAWEPSMEFRWWLTQELSKSARQILDCAKEIVTVGCLHACMATATGAPNNPLSEKASMTRRQLGAILCCFPPSAMVKGLSPNTYWGPAEVSSESNESCPTLSTGFQSVFRKGDSTNCWWPSPPVPKRLRLSADLEQISNHLRNDEDFFVVPNLEKYWRKLEKENELCAKKSAEAEAAVACIGQPEGGSADISAGPSAIIIDCPPEVPICGEIGDEASSKIDVEHRRERADGQRRFVKRKRKKEKISSKTHNHKENGVLLAAGNVILNGAALYEQVTDKTSAMASNAVSEEAVVQTKDESLVTPKSDALSKNLAEVVQQRRTELSVVAGGGVANEAASETFERPLSTLSVMANNNATLSGASCGLQQGPVKLDVAAQNGDGRLGTPQVHSLSSSIAAKRRLGAASQGALYKTAGEEQTSPLGFPTGEDLRTLKKNKTKARQKQKPVLSQGNEKADVTSTNIHQKRRQEISESKLSLERAVVQNEANVQAFAWGGDTQYLTNSYKDPRQSSLNTSNRQQQHFENSPEHFKVRLRSTTERQMERRTTERQMERRTTERQMERSTDTGSVLEDYKEFLGGNKEELPNTASLIKDYSEVFDSRPRRPGAGEKLATLMDQLKSKKQKAEVPAVQVVESYSSSKNLQSAVRLRPFCNSRYEASVEPMEARRLRNRQDRAAPSSLNNHFKSSAVAEPRSLPQNVYKKSSYKRPSKKELEQALQNHNMSCENVAKILGVHCSTVMQWTALYGLDILPPASSYLNHEERAKKKSLTRNDNSKNLPSSLTELKNFNSRMVHTRSHHVESHSTLPLRRSLRETRNNTSFNSGEHKNISFQIVLEKANRLGMSPELLAADTSFENRHVKTTIGRTTEAAAEKRQKNNGFTERNSNKADILEGRQDVPKLPSESGVVADTAVNISDEGSNFRNDNTYAGYDYGCFQPCTQGNSQPEGESAIKGTKDGFVEGIATQGKKEVRNFGKGDCRDSLRKEYCREKEEMLSTSTSTNWPRQSMSAFTKTKLRSAEKRPSMPETKAFYPPKLEPRRSPRVSQYAAKDTVQGKFTKIEKNASKETVVFKSKRLQLLAEARAATQRGETPATEYGNLLSR